jgi:3-oxoacyl-(acyl-carrier-protein) synthase
MNRVVITGYGVVSPIGNDPETFLTSLKEGTMQKQQESLLQVKSKIFH